MRSISDLQSRLKKLMDEQQAEIKKLDRSLIYAGCGLTLSLGDHVHPLAEESEAKGDTLR